MRGIIVAVLICGVLGVGGGVAANRLSITRVAPVSGVPVNIAVPTISGTAQVGQTLTAANGAWTNLPGFARQWNRAGTPIGGATDITYVPVTADIGNTLTVSIIATNAAGLGITATSAATGSVAAAGSVPVNTAVPTISGTAQVDQTLTSTNGSWTQSPTSFTRQWNRAGTPISGATATTYVPVTADIGNTLTVSVTATNSFGSSSPATSAATSAVTASGGTCPKGTSFPDGCGAAVAGTPNNPTLLDGYGANRPPWNVAGVDYRVGHSGTLLDPSVGGNLPSCATYSGTAGAHSVTVNSSPCTVDHFDLTLNGGTCLNVSGGITSGGTVTLTNNNVKAGANCQPSGGGIVNVGGNATVIIRYNTLDVNYVNMPSNIINIGGDGLRTVEYNVLLRPAQHTVSFQGNGDYTVRYNYSLGEGCCDNHGDWVIIAGTTGTTFSLNEEFNTVTIDPDTTDLGHTATAFCYMETYSVNLTSARCANDTYVSSLSVDGRGHVGYVIRVWPAGNWSPGPIEVKDNYVDATGSFGWLLVNSGAGNPTITCSGNKDLVTGAARTGTYGYATCN